MSALDPRAPRRGDRWIALLLCAATFVAMAFTEKSIGFTRDEGFYFNAGSSYAKWFEDLWTGAKAGLPLQAFGDEAIARRFENNHEHPVLMKSLYGLSHKLLSEKLGLLRDAAGFRVPAWLAAGLLSALLFLFGSRFVSRAGGVLAVLAFWLAPRHFFHAHIACFDVPIACAWLFVVYAYWRSLSPGPAHRRWSIITGVAFGLALAIKHNAWIIPGVLLIHWALADGPSSARGAWREGPGRRARAFLSSLAPFGALFTIGPLLFFLHWPYLWHKTWERLAFYVEFHTGHVNYPWEYFGTVLAEAPFPPFYAFGLTLVTLPLATLLLATTGTVVELARAAAGLLPRRLASPFARLASPIDSDSLLVLGNAFASLVVFSLPFTPIFGGMKHWLPSMVFLSLFAARALVRASSALASLWPRAKSAALPVLASLALAPGLVGVIHNHPYGPSFYNELAGGYPGGASLGMHRQYWSANVTGVLPWLNEHAPKNARIYFHEVTWDSFVAYKKAKMLREDIQMAGDIKGSQLAVYQYMPEFRGTEYDIWNEYGTRVPAHGLYLDETPQIVVYQRR